ncbi:ankyrin repeat domain-containing protein 17-like isoform X1 [Selaginella moellendorffii]|uniref:ankyrin repeat domain-containing protein 17-like isoform X1 n=1 Tax=Selaginella moellendorffii TaxID=88036 RepID=UPI000D1C327F|nr:ankyrin repeat domain-containing protein 17-like isoform X1 [Selaginella moellendorffii]|eukprot:XP_024541349.1 ankyrin repeat domain-containing protein 17-like isoform X1 [Selaginella moellendorffii]
MYAKTMAGEHAVSQRLIECALAGDVLGVSEALSDQIVDVNYKGPVSLRVKHTDSIQHEEAPDEVKIDHEIFKTDVTALFAAAHAGHIYIAKMLLLAGADPNEKLFRGYASTAAAREGHHEIVNCLQRSGAGQLALEDALLEACLYHQVKSVHILISSEMIRPEVLVQALAYASNRGFVDVVEALIQSGVDINSWYRMLLRSAKPALHANVRCTPLISAIVGRQVHVVKYLLEAGAKTGCKASLGAWSWEPGSLEEVRVGAGLASPYNELWCAVEYWEETGAVLELLLNYFSPNDDHFGRTILCHAILCRNAPAVELLFKSGANVEDGIHTKAGEEFPPLLLALKYGSLPILQTLISHGCDLNVVGANEETGLMLAARLGLEQCCKELLLAGADAGFINTGGNSALTVAKANGNGASFNDVIWKALESGCSIQSSNLHVFSQLHFAAKRGDVKVMSRLLKEPYVEVNAQDQYGYTALMIAAQSGHVEVFRLLVHAGADMNLKNRKGETAICLATYSGWLEQLEKILLDSILCDLLKVENFKPLHFASWRGNLEGVSKLLKHGYAVNLLDEEGYSPLMLAAKEGHAEACRVLLNAGADCNLANGRGETALTLAKRAGSTKAAEEVLLDHLAMKLVLLGGQLSKHTRQGKGTPHLKSVRMLRTGLLTWGNTSRRTVACKEAGLGASSRFQKNRRSSDDGPGIFRVITSTGREVHFQASGESNADLWVRGINVIVKEAARAEGKLAK